MAITIRDIEQHYYMIEELKSLTESNVTTKALIKGGYLAVDLGKQLEDEKQKRLAAEAALVVLQDKVKAYMTSQQSLLQAVASVPAPSSSPIR
ncbi:hypothetical protein L4C36_14535 [Photobacterium japonica]|uniref:hypothetical protein n=1 Tax=Photobacterium japonica TaxID=2910235 RepID=UPI003D0A4319